jgi:alkylation response protein AidB-like acyl-CoA dehydrogenase
MLAAVEEFATECSIVKVASSEMLDYVVDEGVQIHGGYGFHQDYAVERAYRDSRINRIFEGTNEINRLLIPGMLLKRATRGRLDLKPNTSDNAKRLALQCLDAAKRKFGDALEQQQEVLTYIADMIIEAYIMESALLRARKSGKEWMSDMAQVILHDGTARVESAARNVMAAIEEPVNTVDQRRRIAARLL